MATITREQGRAARALLDLKQKELAALAGVGEATIVRWEAGREVNNPNLQALKRAFENAGVVFLSEGARVDGRRIGVGVAMQYLEDLPATTRERLTANRTRS